MLRKVSLVFSLLLVLSVGTKASHKSMHRQRPVSMTTGYGPIIIDDVCYVCPEGATDPEECEEIPCDPQG
jgi:hypothetical protein